MELVATFLSRNGFKPQRNGVIAPLRLLLLEDRAADADLLIAELRRAGVQAEVKVVGTRAAYLKNLDSTVDAIISDFDLPQFNAKEALALLQAQQLDIPLIVVSGAIGEETAVDLMRLGAADYLLRDRLARLPQALARAVEARLLRAERLAVQQQLLLQSTAVEAAGNAIFVTDRSGAILLVNPAFTALTGYTAEEVLGKTPRVLKSGKHDQAFYRKLWKTILSGQTWRGEFTNRRKDGSLFYDEHTITPVRSEGGEITHFIGIMHDVTERRQAEEALRLFRTLVDQFNDTFEVIDPETARFLDVNEKGCTELGYSRAEYLALRVFDIDPTIKPSAWPQLVERMRATGSLSGEGFHRRKDGTTFPIEFNAKWVRLDRDYVVTVVRDITERKRAEARVREQAEMLDHAHDAIIVRDIHTGQITFWNQGAERLYGWTAAEAVGRNIGKLIFADPSAPKAVTEQLLKTGEWHGEHKHVSKAGEKLTVSSHATLVRDADGQPKSALLINIDITERERVVREQREAGEKIRAIINSVEGIVWEADATTLQFSFVSDRAEALLGYPRKRWLEEQDFWKNHVHPEDRARTLAMCAEAIEEVRSHVIEYRMLAADGREVWLRDSVRVISDGGRPVTLRGIMTDITEAKHTADRLRAREAQIREQAKLLDLAHDAIMVRDMEDRVEYWNQGAEKLYGWNAAEVQGKEASSFLHERAPAAFAAVQAAVIENGKWTGECKHTCKDGDTVIVRSRWTLVRDELAKPKAILIIDTDVTEQKRAEEQFLRAQRLEGIGTLASGVAHDLNNILAPILMGAAVLRRTEMPKEDEAILSTIETCAQRGADIVKQVLTFARGAEGARLLLQPAHLITDMAKIAEATFPKTITVRTVFPQSLWPIEGDPTQLHQVLLNLSVNARDAMPAGGTLTISAENFPVDEHYASMTPGAKAGPHVLLEVTDTGTGISRQIIDKIFDPFFTTKEPGHGTGLGLSTVIGIVKSHGGFVSVYSEIGRGTTFKVYLPAMMGAPETPEESETTAPPPANGELLLIVDDEEPILQVARALLEGHGYQVLTAGDAPEALALFAMRKDEIKLVLADLAMPLMDGLALIRTLQKMKPDVRIIASTGLRSLEQRVHELASLNVRTCLSKPYNKHTLLTTLHDALGAQKDEL